MITTRLLEHGMCRLLAGSGGREGPNKPLQLTTTAPARRRRGWGGENPLCPVLKNLTKVGDETIGGARTTRYTATETIDALWGHPDETLKIFNTFDYWIDAEDQFV